MDHLAAAEEQDHGQAQVRQEADERVVERAQARGEHRALEDGADDAAEALELALLGRERLDHAHARDVLLDVGGQLRDALLDLRERGPRAAPVARGDQHHERHGDQRQRRQPGLDRQHRDAREQDRQPALQDEHEAVAEEEAHRLQVDGQARHQLAGLLAVEERQLELLQVRVQAVAQVVLDAERDLARHQAASDRERQPRERHEHDRHDQALEAVAVARVDPVDRPAGQPRDRDGGRHGQRREHQRGHHSGPVRAQEAEEPEEGAHTTTDYEALGTSPAHLQHSRRDDGSDRTPQPLRHGQGRVGRAPARRSLPGARATAPPSRRSSGSRSRWSTRCNAARRPRPPSRPPTRCGASFTRAPTATPSSSA